MVADETSLFDSAERFRPAPAVVDLSLVPGDNLHWLQRHHARCPDVKLIVISVHDEARVRQRAMDAGADGFDRKRDISTDLLPAIHDVLSGLNSTGKVGAWVAAVAPGVGPHFAFPACLAQKSGFSRLSPCSPPVVVLACAPSFRRMDGRKGPAERVWAAPGQVEKLRPETGTNLSYGCSPIVPDAPISRLPAHLPTFCWRRTELQ